jgi:ketosteroid isomerase-like protein
MATREQDIVNRMYEELNAHDPDALARFYSEDCEVVAPPGELRGRDAVRALAQTYWNAFSDLKWRTTGQYASGDTVVTEEILDRYRGDPRGHARRCARLARWLHAGVGQAPIHPSVRGRTSAGRRDRVASPLLGQRRVPPRRGRGGDRLPDFVSVLRRYPARVVKPWGARRWPPTTRRPCRTVP